jgi:hypothetical protein
MRVFGKENLQPEMPVRSHTHQPHSTSQGFPPQVFHDPAFNPLYNPLNSYYSRPSAYEYSLGFNIGSATTNTLSSEFRGDFRPLDSTPRRDNEPGQSEYTAGSSNMSGRGMQFGL